jgi:hypothetical protein
MLNRSAVARVQYSTDLRSNRYGFAENQRRKVRFDGRFNLTHPAIVAVIANDDLHLHIVGRSVAPTRINLFFFIKSDQMCSPVIFAPIASPSHKMQVARSPALPLIVSFPDDSQAARRLSPDRTMRTGEPI